jgi:ribosomal protein L37AE/L43A
MPDDDSGKWTISDKNRDNFKKKEKEEQDKQPNTTKCPECKTDLTKENDCTNGIWHCPYCDKEF